MISNHIVNMKKQLEIIFGIEIWNPTEKQLIDIWNKLAKLPDGVGEDEVLKVINSIYGELLNVSSMEGLDTSSALTALYKIKEMQSDIKSVENKNINTSQKN